MRPLPWILALVVVAALAVATWLLLGEDEAALGEGVSVDVVERDPPEATLPAAPAAEARPLEVTDAAVTPVTAAVEDVAPVMPESYRRALGGLTGRLVEASGEPVPDTQVQLVGGGTFTFLQPMDVVLGEEPPALAVELAADVTDRDGRFLFEQIEPRVMAGMVVDPGGPRAHLAVLDQSPESGRLIDVGDVVLPAHVRLVGRVVDGAGEPVAGVRVRATDLPAIAVNSGVADYRRGGGVLVDLREEGEDLVLVFRPDEHLARLERLLPIPTATTDGHGAFALDGVRPGLVTVVLDDGVHASTLHGPSPTGPAGGERDLGDLLIDDGVTLRGRVLDDEEEPVAGAQVLAGNRSPLGPVAILRGPLTTDAEGRFEVTGLRPMEAYAAARRESGHDFSHGEPVTAGAEELIVHLLGKRSLTLAVLDHEAEPVDGVSLLGRMLPDDDAEDLPDFLLPPRPLDHRTSRDEDGRWVVDGLDPGYWDVVVHASGHTLAREVYDLTGGDAEGALTLENELTLDVTVLTSRTSEPVHFAEVTAYEEDSGRDRPLTSGRTDDEGRVTLTRLEEGAYALEVVHPGLAVTAATVRVPDQGEVVVHLQDGGSIVGTAVDAGMPPVEPLLVVLARKDDGDKVKASALPRYTATDLDGRFRFDNVEAGTVQVSLRERFEYTGLMNWWEPLAMSPLAEQELLVTAARENEVTLVVGSSLDGMATGRVSGKLLVNGRPAPDWKVRTWGRVRRSTTTDNAGRFDMGRLAAGEVTLVFSPPGASMMEGGAVDTHTFELLAEADEWVRMEIATGAVEGLVVDDVTGLVVEGARVSVMAAENDGSSWMTRRRVGAATDRHGRFRVEPVAEGTYVASAEAQGYARQASAPFEVVSHRPVLGLEVRLSRAVRVSGRVVLEGFGEVDPEWMWLTAESGSGTEAAARVDESDFSFTFDDLAPDEWTFTLHADLGQEIATATARIRGERDDLVLVFPPAPPPEPVELEGLSGEQVQELKELGYVDDGGGK